MGSRLDMSVMLAIHGALRRDLEEVARLAGKRDQASGARLRAAPGWEQFKKFLVIHHKAEDDVLWPVLRAEATGSADGAALVDALEAEHAVVEPLLNAVDEAAGDHEDRGRLADAASELVTRLAGHLDHEESEGFALIEASLAPEQWQRFGKLHGQRLLGDAPVYVPWLLDGASPGTADGFLAVIPPHLVAAYRDQWAPAYAKLTIWGAADEPPATPRSAR